MHCTKPCTSPRNLHNAHAASKWQISQHNKMQQVNNDTKYKMITNQFISDTEQTYCIQSICSDDDSTN